MTAVLVSGGWFDSSGECWVDRVSPRGQERLLTFVPPEPYLVPTKGFTGMIHHNDRLLICTFNAIWAFDRSGSCEGRLHLPHFNDLHGIAIDPATNDILVCNTGLDSIERLSMTGTWRARYAMSPPSVECDKLCGNNVSRADFPHRIQAGWQHPPTPECSELQSAEDYYNKSSTPFTSRKLRDFMHPNHVFFSKRAGWCTTLLHDRTIRSLHTHEPIVQYTQSTHDGIDSDDGIWCTSIDGEVLCSTRQTTERVCSLRETPVHGWCRGLALTEQHIVVGVTAMRKQQTHVQWQGGDWKTSTTAVVWFDRKSKQFSNFIDMTDHQRGAKIFAIVQDV
jgi:hypothetical protein